MSPHAEQLAQAGSTVTVRAATWGRSSLRAAVPLHVGPTASLYAGTCADRSCGCTRAAPGGCHAPDGRAAVHADDGPLRLTCGAEAAVHAGRLGPQPSAQGSCHCPPGGQQSWRGWAQAGQQGERRIDGLSTAAAAARRACSGAACASCGATSRESVRPQPCSTEGPLASQQTSIIWQPGPASCAGRAPP